VPVNDDASEELVRAQRDLAYYKRECDSLGDRLLRLQEEQVDTSRALRRRSTVLRLMREIYRQGDRPATPASINLTALMIIVENTLCDRAVLLREETAGSGEFVVQNGVGFTEGPPPVRLSLPRPPEFYYTTGVAGRNESIAEALSGCLGVPYLLWAYDKPTGYAMLIGNRLEVNASRPFEDHDREIIEAALTVFLDALMRQARQSLPPGPAPLSPIDGTVVRSHLSGLQEAEIQDHLRDDERIVGMVVVERSGRAGTEFAPYLATTWRHGYCILRTAKNRSDRTYKDLNRLIQFARECGYVGSVTVYAAGAEELRQLDGIRADDLYAARADDLIADSIDDRASASGG
jgi:hypothetical protein